MKEFFVPSLKRGELMFTLKNFQKIEYFFGEVVTSCALRHHRRKEKKKFVHILNTIEKEEGKSFSRFGKFEIQKRIIHGRKDRAARPVKKEEDHVLS